MSYDLYFCSRRNEIVDFDKVAAWAAAVGNFTQNKQQLWYENKATGVYFSLDFELGLFDSPEDNVIPPGFFYAGLSFNLNYNRPTFFAYEAMPIVEEISIRFDLCIFDPQREDDQLAQCLVERDSLISSWTSSNYNAIKVMVEEGVEQDFYMPLANSMYLWNYMRQRSELQAACGEQIYAPSLVPVKRKSEIGISTAFVITEDIPALIPQSSWIFLVGSAPSEGNRKVAAIDSESFLQLIRPHLVAFEWKDLGLYVISPESVHTVGRLLKTLKTFPRDDFDVLAADSFVDIAK